ncbi:MAG: Na+/H+ antiporter subunit E [Chloroflexota bacterium]
MSSMIITSLTFSLLYLLITADWDIPNISMSILVGVVLVVLIKPVRNQLSIRQLPAWLMSVLKYVVLLIWDIWMNGIVVAKIVLSREIRIRPGILAIPTECENELARALSIHALTVTPGECVIFGDKEYFYVHTLDLTHPDQVAYSAHRLREELLCKIAPG